VHTRRACERQASHGRQAGRQRTATIRKPTCWPDDSRDVAVRLAMSCNIKTERERAAALVQREKTKRRGRPWQAGGRRRRTILGAHTTHESVAEKKKFNEKVAMPVKNGRTRRTTARKQAAATKRPLCGKALAEKEVFGDLVRYQIIIIAREKSAADTMARGSARPLKWSERARERTRHDTMPTAIELPKN